MSLSDLPSEAATPDPRATTTATDETPKPKRWLGGLFSPFGVRNFRLLFGGQLTSNLGDAFYAVALPWYMLAHGGPEALGLLLLAYGVPRTVFIAAGGSLADKLRPRPLMLIADGARTVLIAAFALLISGLVTAPPFWQLAALSAGYGLFSGLFMPASMSILPDLLPDDELQAGNSLYSSSAQLTNLVGPALGGFLVGFFAPWIALLADAATFLVSALSLGAMRASRTPTPTAMASAAVDMSPPSTTDEIAAGQMATSDDGTLPIASTDGTLTPAADEPRTLWQLVRRSPLLQVMLVVSIVGNLSLGGLVEVALPALIQGPLHATALQFGFVLGGFAVGALLGGLSAGLLGRLPARGVFMCLLWFAQAVVLGLVPYVGGLVGAGVLFGAMGLFNGSSNIFVITAIQQRMPRALLGRVMGAIILTSLGLYPLSVAAAGYLVQMYGPAVLFPASAALMVLAVLMAVSRRAIREL